MEDSYQTISSKQIGEGYYTEKRSKFLAFAHHVETVDEAMEIVAGYHKKYYDARHVCYAYMLGAARKDFRANDNGEPSGTAGKPILGQINSNELTDILIIVVRYFGGIKLGADGLIRAYSGSVAHAIEEIGRVEVKELTGLTVELTYSQYQVFSNFLEKEGFRITYLPVDKDGIVDIEALKNALDDETILVSVMYVNNEIGAVEPIEKIGHIIKDYNPDIVYHVDAIQAYGKYKIYPKKLGIDLLSVSGHKIHGPKGAGFLYVDSRVKIKPIIFGGEQQKNMRSGTENVPGIAGLAKAAEMLYSRFDEDHARLCA